MKLKSTIHWSCWLLVSIVLGLLSSVLTATEKIRLFDGHIHYNRDVWTIYTPEAALAQLEKAGIGQALISSTPDEGTIKLYKLAPEHVIPILRPYRTPTDRHTWYQDPQILNYLRERLRLGMHQGIGEFHLFLAPILGLRTAGQRLIISLASHAPGSPCFHQRSKQNSLLKTQLALSGFSVYV